MTPRLRGAVLALLVALGVALACLPSPARAHAGATGSDPADGEVLPEPPPSVTVTFSEPVSLASSGTQLLDADGDPVDAGLAVRDRALTITPEEPLPDGTYVVAWRVVSADTHPVSGGLTFSVGAPSATAVALPDDTEAADVRVARVAATAVQYAGVLLLVGLVAVTALLAPTSLRHDPLLARRWRRWGGAAAVAAVAGAGSLVPLTVVWEAGGRLPAVLAVDTWADAVRGPASGAAVVVLAGVALAVVGLRAGRDAPALAGAGTAMAGLVAVGHTRSYGPPPLVLVADVVHVAAGAVWFGGLVAVGTALAARAGCAGDRARLVSRFSTAAAAAVAALALSGVLVYSRVAGSLEGLWTSDYGRTLLAKSAVVVPVVALAAWNRFRLVPRAGRPSDDGAGRLLARTVRWEAALLVGVVALTGVLVNRTPPARDAAPVAVALVEELRLAVDADHDGSVVVTPARRGVNGVRLRITDRDGAPVALAGVPTLSFSLPTAELGPLRRPVTVNAAGEWEASVELPLPGTWDVSVAVPLDEFSEPVVTGRFEVP